MFDYYVYVLNLIIVARIGVFVISLACVVKPFCRLTK